MPVWIREVQSVAVGVVYEVKRRESIWARTSRRVFCSSVRESEKEVSNVLRRCGMVCLRRWERLERLRRWRTLCRYIVSL